MSQGVVVCDFCSTPGPEWSFPCRDFMAAPADAPPWLLQGFKGPWLACSTCRQYVDANDRLGLAIHCAGVLSRRHVDVPLGEGIIRCQEVQSMFFDHRDGPAVRVPEGRS